MTTTDTTTTTPTARDHLVAVVDTATDASTLPVARAVVRAGGRATVLVSLGRQDQQHIRDFAEAEHLSSGEAESRYLAALDGRIREELGPDTAVHVTGPAGTSVREVAAVAGDATQIAIPSTLARRRSWRRAIGRTGTPVTVTPSAA